MDSLVDIETVSWDFVEQLGKKNAVSLAYLSCEDLQVRLAFDAALKAYVSSFKKVH